MAENDNQEWLPYNRFEKPPIPIQIHHALIVSQMQVPIQLAQISVPALEGYSFQDLSDLWDSITKAPPSESFEAFYPQNLSKFSPEEDYFLYLYNNTKERIPLLEYCRDFIVPGKSISQIENRLKEIRQMTPEQKEKIIDSFMEVVIADHTFSDEERQLTDHQSFCHYSPFSKIIPTPESQKELETLTTRFLLSSPTDLFHPNDLGLFRSEKFLYRMRREMIVIGRATVSQRVDIDLTPEMQLECSHISRTSAVFYLDEKGDFYLENVGHNFVRVNGVPIKHGEECIVPHGAILDFANVLLMFMSNTKFVQQLKQYMANPTPATARLRRGENINDSTI